MKKVKVIALKDHVFEDTPKKTGEVYEADPWTVDRFIVFGFVARMNAVEKPKPEEIKQKYRRRDMKAE